jgi:MoxR-like ATPase
MLKPVLRHRLVLTTDADLSDIDPIEIVTTLSESISPPESEGIDTDAPDPSSDDTVALSDTEEQRG